VLLGVSDCGETDNEMSWIISEQGEELAEETLCLKSFVRSALFSKHVQSLTRRFGCVSSVAERVQDLAFHMLAEVQASNNASLRAFLPTY
jgi:hypothetical protein